MQPTPQSRHRPAQLTVGSEYGTLVAHPPQAAAPVLHLEIRHLSPGLEIEFYHAVMQPWQISTARDVFLHKGYLAVCVSNEQDMRLPHAWRRHMRRERLQRELPGNPRGDIEKRSTIPQGAMQRR